MRSYLFLNRMLLALVISSQSSFYPANEAVHARFDEANSSPVESSTLNVDVALTTLTGSTIFFEPGKELQETNPGMTAANIPHLVLKRNGVLASDAERTLLISVNDLAVPNSGLFLDLTIETQHSDPDVDAENNSITIWRERHFVPHVSEQAQSVEFSILFDETTALESGTVQTPTDYYGYRLSVTNTSGEQMQDIVHEYAFLLENQWVAPLPNVLEETANAAPDRLIAYYCDMFPFQRDMRDPSTRLQRNDIEPYIQAELLPAMVAAFETQSNLWDLPWYAEWSSYRAEDSPRTLSVALAEYGTWYHGPAPSLGYESISIRVNGSYGEYANLTDGLMSVFHHELFHSQQRNISLHFRGNGHLAGKDDAWKMFSEGTAVLASAVGQPSVEFESVMQPRSYVKRARAFLGQDGLIGGGLNKPYTDIPYHTALYWRFLYEHCGGLVDGREVPAAGMQVIRHILEVVYQGRVVDIESSSDTVSALPAIVDLALQQTPSCEFETYEESMLRFSEAIYRLRVQNRLHTLEIADQPGEFFDPHHLYPAPNAEKYAVQSQSVTLVNGSIPASYGIDLMELDLGPLPNRRTLQMMFESSDGGQEKFCMQVWQIEATGNSSEADAGSVVLGDPGLVCTQDGHAILNIDLVNEREPGTVGIAITRLDALEDMGVGEYTLSIHSE